MKNFYNEPDGIGEIFSVVIPYYQTEPSLLTSAVQSILIQKIPKGLKVLIVIVDDESPSPASLSIEALTSSDQFSIEVLHQENGGAASARNCGLEFLAEIKPKYVAFLDSDDEWLEDHIWDAVVHIDQGADFWFADNRAQLVSSNGLILKRDASKTQNNSQINDIETGLISLSGREAFALLLRRCIPHTSTVVYNFRHHSRVRFSTQLKLAGEDYLFWLTLAFSSEKVMFTSVPKSIRGEGVSIYQSNLSWDSPKSIDVKAYQTLLRHIIDSDFKLTSEERVYNNSRYEKNFKHLVSLMLRNLIKNPRGAIRKIAGGIKIVPIFYRRFPEILFSIIIDKLRHKMLHKS